MNERFVFDGRCYKTVALKSGENHCEKCAFNECRECEYSPVIPYCDADKRNDGQNVYFVETKTNFDRITESPEALANAIVRLWVREVRSFPAFVWLGIKDDDSYETFENLLDAISKTLDWLNKEVENEHD